MADTITYEWEIEGGENGQGGKVTLYYTCPYCHDEAADRFFFAPGYFDDRKGSFETTATCACCGRDVTVACLARPAE